MSHQANDLYEAVKAWSATTGAVPLQCVLAENVISKPGGTNPRYLASLLMKTSSILGGCNAYASSQVVHPGVTCDKSGMCPIVGPRYNLRGMNYDLCQAEFDKLSPDEQAKYVKIEAPWRPKSWHGFGGGLSHKWYGNDVGGGDNGCQGITKLVARFVKDISIFDGTQMVPGTRFTKIWRIKNDGEAAWPCGTMITLVGGDRMAADMTVPIAEPNNVVLPGEEVNIAVDMVAPAEAGRYMGYWRLVGPLGRRRFGQRLWCNIQVVHPELASDAPHHPSAVAAEISSMMADGQKDDRDAEDNGGDDAKGSELSCLPVRPAASSSASSSSCAQSAAAEACVVPCNLKQDAGVQVNGLSASAATEDRKHQAPADEFTEGDLVNKDSTGKEPKTGRGHEPTTDGGHEPTLEGGNESTPEGGNELTTEGGNEPVGQADKEPMAMADVATMLLIMGFDAKCVEMVVAKHSADNTPTNTNDMLERCTSDLVQLSGWDAMLGDLEEM